MGFIFTLLLIVFSGAFLYCVAFYKEGKNLRKGPLKFYDSKTLTSSLKLLLYAQISAFGLSMIATANNLFLLISLKNNNSAAYIWRSERDFYSENIYPVNEFLFGMHLIIFVVLLLLKLCWVYRSNINARALGGQNLTFTPLTSVGNTILPFFQEYWIGPYKVIEEIWKVSQSPLNWKAEKAHNILAVWYFLFLTTLIYGFYVYWKYHYPVLFSISVFIEAQIAYLVFYLLGVFLCLSSLNIVKSIYNLQLNALAKAESESNNETKNKPKFRAENVNKSKNSSQRIILCPTCTQKIRFFLPLTAKSIKCQACHTTLEVHVDVDGHVYVTTHDKKQDNNYERESDTLSVADCFKVLGLAMDASPDEVKLSYKKRIVAYHPDKVSKLGDKIRTLAEEESKEINIAYSILKKRGYA